MKQILLFIVLIFMIGYVPSGHAAEPSSEYELKAAYLYNFAKFIHWPEDTFADKRSPLIIGVLGKNPFQTELLPLTSRTVRKRPIEIRQFNTVKDVRNCHLLYISQSVSNKLRTILKNLRTKPIVTVGDDMNFVNLGGMFQFVTRRDRLRFTVHLDVAKANAIKIDAQLLSLAVEIQEAGK